jgi:hypothetical protein
LTLDSARHTFTLNEKSGLNCLFGREVIMKVGMAAVTARPWLCALLSLLLAAGCASTVGDRAGRFEIGLIGDQHYDAESTAMFPNIMAALDRAELAFVVHVGDIGSPTYGSCLDETYYRRRDEFNASRHPFFYTPGDNDWTDCHQAGIPDSLERLAKLREVFFQGERSLGRSTLPLTRQSADSRHAKFRENARWTHGGVLFVTVHIPGSNNNLGRTPEMDAEYAERNAANLEWLRQSFRYAKESSALALMILIQANPRIEETLPARRRSALGIGPLSKKASGFDDFLKALREQVLAYDRPVALVHGDTHYFRVDKPMILDDQRGAKRGSVVEHFTRVELFGYPEAHWVRATIDPADPSVFSFTPMMVRQNFIERRK